jgi:hypothetical protein
VGIAARFFMIFTGLFGRFEICEEQVASPFWIISGEFVSVVYSI